MEKKLVIAIVDIGKTNKKLLLFDQHYSIVFNSTHKLEETLDEDGDACEDLEKLLTLVLTLLKDVLALEQFDIQAINFTAYGASFVYVNEEGKTIGSLYNYLKPFPKNLQTQFYFKYGGDDQFSLKTASPVLGNLNSGMQLYRLKYTKPALFNKIKYALHLPQFLCYLISGQPVSEITSIGCHTNLWNFETKDYHTWVSNENIQEKLPPMASAETVVNAFKLKPQLKCGIGLHDTSAALIPYLLSFKEPFILISTGTWCISMNPFNQLPLTLEELKQDCLCYLTYQGNSVKASRLFAGQEHEDQVKAIAKHFKVEEEFYKEVRYNTDVITKLNNIGSTAGSEANSIMESSGFMQRPMNLFSSPEEAYHRLMMDIMDQQVASAKLVFTGSKITRIFVDGGFSKNALYMNLISLKFPHIEVYAASMAQATAIGAALAIHDSWNTNPIPADLIQLKFYSSFEAQRV